MIKCRTLGSKGGHTLYCEGQQEEQTDASLASIHRQTNVVYGRSVRSSGCGGSGCQRGNYTMTLSSQILSDSGTGGTTNL